MLVRPHIIRALVSALGGVLGTALPWESGGAPAPWTPTMLGAKLTMWLDEREQTNAGAGALSAWGNQIPGGANDMTQGTGANRPTIGATINGYSAPTFTTNDFVSGATSASFIAAQAIHCFAVVKPSAITRTATASGWFGGHTIVGDSGGAGGNWGLVFYEDTGVDYAAMGVFTSASGKSARAAVSPGTTYLLEGRYDGTNVAIRVGAGAEVTASATNNVLLTTATAVGLGFTGSFLEGDVATVIICNAALSAAERSAARAYLAAKYGVAA